MQENGATGAAPNGRVKLHPVDRTAPVRGGTLDIFGPPPVFAREGADAEATPGPTEAVRRTIERAYGVVDEHMRQGESAARRIVKRDYGAAAFANDVQDAAARSMMFAAEVFEVWMQAGAAMGSSPNGASGSPFASILAMLGAAAATAQPGAGSAAPPSSAASAAFAKEASGARVVVSVDSAQPAELTVDLHDPSKPFVLQPLHGPGGVITSHGVEGFDPPRIRLRVPADHPTGVYSGLAVDPVSNLPVGSVTLILRPRDTTPNGGEMNEAT